MTDFDRLVTEASIRARVGEPDAIDPMGREVETPLKIFVEIAERASDQRIDLFWVDGGIPGHFALRGGERLTVVFHSRQVELCAHLGTITIDGGWDDKLRSELFEGAALRMIAEFLLQRGYVDQALQTLARSRQVQGGFFFVEPRIDDLEHLPLDERYLVEWFFGLGHEIGHAVGGELGRTFRRIEGLSPERISQVIEAVIDRRFTVDARDKLTDLLGRVEAGELPLSHASPSVLRGEATADLFSVLCLCRAWEPIRAASGGDELRLDVLLAEAVVSMGSVMAIEQCRMLADWFHGMHRELELQPLMLAGVALQARMNLLLHTLADDSTQDLLTRALLRAGFGGLDTLRTFRVEELAGFLETLEVRSEALSTGMVRARTFLSSPEMRDVELFTGYLEEVARDATRGLDALRFLGVARSQGSASPELALLAEVAGRWAPEAPNPALK